MASARSDEFLARRGDLLAAGARAEVAADRVDPATGESLARLRRRYRDLLPAVPVARHPDDGTVIEWPLDVAGLDGWCWDHDNPVRRLPVGLPADWLCMTGAVDVSSPVAPAPFLCRPGPRRPSVLPRLLSLPGVRAVVCPVRIGPDRAWAVTYFGPFPTGVRLVNLWGTRRYPVWRGGEWIGENEAPYWSPDNDFDLSGWVADGRLFWIEPDDPTLQLRTDPRVPWSGHDGSTENAIIVDGTVRYPPSPPAAARHIRVAGA